MNTTPTSAASLRRRSVTALVVMIVLALLASTAPAVAAPQRQAPVLLQQVQAEDPVDEEHEFYKQLVGDIRDHAEDVEVRDAAAAALAVGTKERLIWFLDHGQAEAQARAEARKQVERAENRKKVEEWARTGGPNVKAGAQAALAAGDRAIADFVAYGYEIALKRDKQQAEDDKAEQDRIIARVRDMVAHGGPQVRVEGEAVLGTGDYAAIREFYLTGYHEANKRDHDFQLVIEKALEDRNRALTELDQFARRSEAAAKARAEITRANIEVVKTLEDGIFAMQMAVKAAHKADKIFQEDKPGRASGRLGRTAEIDALRAEAAEYAALGVRVSAQAEIIDAQVHNAAVRLVETGMTNGLDWAKVTIGIVQAVKASGLAGETSQHATEATLADSRALDADRNAQEHAANARKYREEAERQSRKAVELAAAARTQHDIAVAARNRAEQQKNLAAQKAAQAQQHAGNARSARVNAQGAAANAIAKSKEASAAYNNAVQHKAAMDETVTKAERLGKQVQVAEHVFGRRVQVYNQFARELEVARKKAEELGGEAWDEYRRIEGETNAAKSAADQSSAWASNARAAAATAQAEARAATNAANAAQAAANQAGKEAVTARRAADETHRIALETTTAAIASKDAAEMVQAEAEDAVREANQAVYQSVVADKAASAAAASAELVIDPVRAAESILKPYAAINADARKALATVAEALLISEEQSRAARQKADEAGQAAIRARQAADQAVGDIKPAYEAAAAAVEAANRAAQDALNANNAANTAAAHAGAASGSAATAARWASSARSDATLAGESANAASHAAATAGQAAAAAETLRGVALGIAQSFDVFENSIVERLNQVVDIRQRYDEAKRLAQQEAEVKRQALNLQAIQLYTSVFACTVSSFSLQCEALKRNVEQKIGAGLAAAGNYVEDFYKCAGGDDEAACKRYVESSKKVRGFVNDAVNGYRDAALGTFDGLEQLLRCGINGANGSWAACQGILQGLWYQATNPYTWTNLDEWQTNPAKALGQVLWDVTLSLATRGPGGVASKSLRMLARKIDGGTGMLSKTIAELDSHVVKLHETVRDKLPDGLVEILNLRAKFQDGNARFDGSVAVVDGQLYRVESFTIRPEGSPNLVDGAKVRLEGGTLRIENGVAKLDDAKLKVEPPKPCAVGVSARAAAATAPGCNGEFSKPVSNADGFKHDLNLGKSGETELGWLGIRLNAQENNWVDALADKAKEVEPEITKAIRDLASRNSGTVEGLDHRFKDDGVWPYPGLKRKAQEEMNPQPKNPLDYDQMPEKRTLAEIAPKMNDALRYTIVFDHDVFAQKAQDAIRQFARQYNEAAFTNFYEKAKDTGYPGINVTYEIDGFYFEVQFHTRDSYEAKSREHPNYDQSRKLRAAMALIGQDSTKTKMEKDQEIRDLMAARQQRLDDSAKIFGPVPKPLNADKVRSGNSTP
ncbi:hypothetical protein AB0M48_27580 [Lentzea sp. NPDC051208]|uniref:hypothetical protein n=1 Tax=Lentzea sp. NPDC051208 TaxID=3154642 RepID=UPI00344849E8